MDIDLYRREVDLLLHRLAVVVHFYRDGLDSGIPLQHRPVLAHRVGLGKGSAEGKAGNRHRDLAGICTGHILYLVIRPLFQLLIGAVGQGNRNFYILRFDGAVIDQIR